jgi:hypothetical protein
MHTIAQCRVRLLQEAGVCVKLAAIGGALAILQPPCIHACAGGRNYLATISESIITYTLANRSSSCGSSDERTG